MTVTPDKSALAQARERLEASMRLPTYPRATVDGMKVDASYVALADLRLVLDALKEAERVADAGKRYFQSHYTRWAEGGGPNECEHGIAAGIDCLLCDEKTLNGWKDSQ